MISFTFNCDGASQAQPLLKMNGFTEIKFEESILVARKPVFKAGGTLLKKRNKPAESKAEANPWDNLDEDKPA